MSASWLLTVGHLIPYLHCTILTFVTNNQHPTMTHLVTSEEIQEIVDITTIQPVY